MPSNRMSKRTRKPMCEPLEPRNLLACFPTGEAHVLAPISLACVQRNGGTVEVRGTSAAEWITASTVRIRDRLGNVVLGVRAEVRDRATNAVTAAGEFPVAGGRIARLGSVNRLHIKAEGGNDIVDNRTSLPSTVFGGPGSDTVRGGGGSDELHGGGDRDIVHGNGGDDRIYGGPANDALFGNDGDDQLYGEDGADWLLGGNHRDWLVGGSDADWLSGGADVDSLFGGADNDWLDGGSGGDVLKGGSGNDLLRGRGGDDSLYGDNGNDQLEGGSGNDGMFGGLGDDSLDGGPGADRFLRHLGNYYYDDAIRFSRDRALDAVAGHDAVLLFQSGAVTEDCEELEGGCIPGYFRPGEIADLDDGFEALHRIMGNTVLLRYQSQNVVVRRMAQGHSGEYHRPGRLPGYSTAVVDLLSLDLGVMIHEMAHNFDFVAGDIERPDGERRMSRSDAWKGFSGWVRNPSDTTGLTRGNVYEWNPDNPWYYSSTANNFGDNYARTNPTEDFAVALEKLLSRLHGRHKTIPAEILYDKIPFLVGLLNRYSDRLVVVPRDFFTPLF